MNSKRRWTLPRFALGVCLALVLAAVADSADTPTSAEIHYGERALRGEDFLAPVPDERPVEDPRAEAYSHTEVRFKYDYRIIKRNRRVRAELTGMDFYAVFVGEKSWNALPQDAKLLDHHEGHFDISQIFAIEAQLEWRTRIREEKLVGEGRTESAARAALEQKINEQLRGYHVSLEREHQYFDDSTRYGTDSEKEMQARAKQKARLKKLQAEIGAERSR